jgi:hypothetical protein
MQLLPAYDEDDARLPRLLRRHVEDPDADPAPL